MANDTAQSQTINILVSSILALTSFSAWISYAFVWLVIVIHYKSFKNRFYLYIIAAGFPDMGILMIICFYNAPCDYAQKEIYSRPYAIGALLNFLNQSQVAYMFYVAVNRCVFALSSNYSRYQISVGSKPKTIWLICLQFSTATILAVYHHTMTNGWRFSYASYAWTEIDCECHRLACRIAQWINWGSFVGLPSVACLLYVIMWISLLVRRHKSKVHPQISDNHISAALKIAKRREMRLLVQFTFITAVSMVDIVANGVVSLYAPNTNFINVFCQLLDVINASANPVAYLLWDKQIRTACLNTVKQLVNLVKQILCESNEDVPIGF